jgi:hypothetical protein
LPYSCDLPIDSQGKFYHIDCRPGDVAPCILKCANHDVFGALEQTANELFFTYHKGSTCATSDFYAGQGRKIDGFPVREVHRDGLKSSRNTVLFRLRGQGPDILTAS